MSAAETAAANANVQPPSPQEVGALLGTLFGQRVEARSEPANPPSTGAWWPPTPPATGSPMS